jgi:ABC-2 type transport system ATP-binding protein
VGSEDDYMIEVKNLIKKYGGQLALNKINFSVGEGEVLGFLGPNGAGKSTTMNILTGYLSFNAGLVNIADYDIMEDPLKAKAKIGYLPEIPPLYVNMTVNSYLKFMFALKKVKLPRNEHIEDVMKKVNIKQVANRIIKNLSKGFRQRVGLAQALLGDPPILILDEPTVGLDPKQIIEIRSLIQQLKSQHTIILSSHILPEVQAICDRILIINKGRIVADSTTADLTAGVKDNGLIAQIEGDSSTILAVIKSIGAVKEVSLGKKTEEKVFEYQISSKSNRDIRRELFRALAAKNAPLLELRRNVLSLEEIFLKLTEGDDTLTDAEQINDEKGEEAS